MNALSLHNGTELSTPELWGRFAGALRGWSTGPLSVRVRYSRGADVSGACHYRAGRILLNLGRHVAYPYQLATHVGRTVASGDRWWKPVYRVELGDAYELLLFVFLHELYHRLVYQVRRNPRQKESMCDRFAARYMADEYGCVIRDAEGRNVEREQWDFQDVEGFVAAARMNEIRAACP